MYTAQRNAHTDGTVLFWVMRPMSMSELGNKRRRRRKNFFLLAAVILSGNRPDTTAERNKKPHKAKVQYANWKDDFNWDFLKFELIAVLLTNSALVEVLRGRLTDSYSVGKGPKRGNKWSLLFFPDLRRGNNNGQMTTSIFFFFFADVRDLPPDIPRYRPTLQIPPKNSNYFFMKVKLFYHIFLETKCLLFLFLKGQILSNPFPPQRRSPQVGN